MHPYDFRMWAPMFVMLIPIVAIVGGITYAIFALRQKTLLQELAYRERIARVERGLTAAPEVDPGRFEAAWEPEPASERAHARSVSGGITLIGVGLGFYWMMMALDAPNVATGVGGFLAILGAAMLANGLVLPRLASSPSRRASAAPSATQPPRDDLNPRPPGL
jgi:hypothetical protein